MTVRSGTRRSITTKRTVERRVITGRRTWCRSSLPTASKAVRTSRDCCEAGTLFGEQIAAGRTDGALVRTPPQKRAVRVVGAEYRPSRATPVVQPEVLGT